MNFEWDAAKAAVNIRKHGISFKEAQTVLESSFAITTDDELHSENEKREKTMGFSERFRVVIVIHTRLIKDTIRIISARKANRREKVAYEEELQWRFEKR
jgi:uncharacterized DUF497 family protein